MNRLAQPLAFLFAGTVAVWAALVPYDAAGGPWPWPDLVFALTLACVIRRPAAAPFWAVAALGLGADLMLSRPPGLGALALLVSAEALRPRAAALRARSFAVEWAAAAGVAAAALLAVDALLALAFLDPLPLDLLARQAATTALAYPFAAAALAALARTGRRAA